MSEEKDSKVVLDQLKFYKREVSRLRSLSAMPVTYDSLRILGKSINLKSMSKEKRKLIQLGIESLAKQIEIEVKKLEVTFAKNELKPDTKRKK